MWPLADKFIDDIIDNGKCSSRGNTPKPFSMLVIADLLGVPEEDHEEFRQMLAPRPGNCRLAAGRRDGAQPAAVARGQFCAYLGDRCANPRDDILTALATAGIPRVTPRNHRRSRARRSCSPSPGQETTTAAVRVHACSPNILRWVEAASDRTRIPAFVEEMLRMESPGEVRVPAGAKKTPSYWRRRHSGRQRPDDQSRCYQP